MFSSHLSKREHCWRARDNTLYIVHWKSNKDWVFLQMINCLSLQCIFFYCLRSKRQIFQLVQHFLLPAACTEDVIFQGPRWRTEPSDLILPINSPDHQATITCKAEGIPSPQYRYTTTATVSTADVPVLCAACLHRAVKFQCCLIDRFLAASVEIKEGTASYFWIYFFK